ncbi:MAG: polyprenyl synthetase family protein [Lachnospiraceae bacterium]|jgi:geranylgeranyl diphosphate synthase type II|nr:polyprenyl synthetase family protein [Lachnospiraceae bacterium]MCI9107823.1 polyprenyl synthetase family protein [Lachnospiraceae bacterium]MCI9341608.1 polyprenyl synthetase family protein [Lachnospiraceae bacterium]GFH90006.1 farnesyl diphosphate synthase [Lachnospiraceae bacterium]
MNSNGKLEDKVKEVEQIIGKYLPEEKGYQKTVIQAMNYSILAGGKRLRPMLLQETYRMFQGTGEVAEPFMAAIEMVHTYSLVHDDLPCMDNDEYRRGKKTTHVVYGEGMAVLAGDGLLNFAFETAVKAFSFAEEKEEFDRIAKALSVFGQKAGIYGMIGGQTADIEAEDMGDGVTEEQLLFIHEHKTAALIQSAMMIGAILAGASKEEVGRIEKCAYNIGIAFQIQDDILDVTGSLTTLGKQTGSDEKNKKTTYVTLKGMEQAVEDVRALSAEAIEILSSFKERNEFLEGLVKRLITREK